MAKEQRESKPLPDATEMAFRLFERFWTPRGNVLSMDSDVLSAMCFQGAKAFLNVAAQIREGRTPEEIISPAEPIAKSESVSVAQ